jgi:hypothetical protein
VAAVTAIRTNLDKNLHQRTIVGLLRRNTPMVNVALGLATLVLVATGIVGWIAVNLRPGTTIAGIDVTALLLVSVAGALGSVVSVMYRIDDFDNGAPRSPVGAYFTGLFKPIIGVGFALFVYAALSAKVITLLQPAPGTEAYFYAALGFVTGFVEKFAPDLITKAQGTLEGASGSRV